MMRKFSTTAACALVFGLGVALAGCGQVNSLKAKMSFKDANGLYKAQDYRGAMVKYQEALQGDPDLTGAYFFLANSADNLYKPARKGEAANDALLPLAVDYYKKAAEMGTDPKIKKLALEYLVSAYNSPDKISDPGQAEPLLLKMIEMEPKESANYFAIAKLYEDNGNYEQAEGMLVKAKEMTPNLPDVYMQLAGYYDRQGEFDKLMDALMQRAQKEPNNPEVYYTISTYYWNKAYRDFRLSEADKRKFTQSGVDAVDKAISLKDDYAEALVYKGLLLRLQANFEKEPAKQQALLREAEKLSARATDLRKQKATGAPGAKTGD